MAADPEQLEFVTLFGEKVYFGDASRREVECGEVGLEVGSNRHHAVMVL